jgi:hypothetical protein
VGNGSGCARGGPGGAGGAIRLVARTVVDDQADRRAITSHQVELVRGTAGKCDHRRMPRIAGLERSQAPWHLRWFYGVMRRMFGKDLTPAKIQMRVPGVMWGSIGFEAALARKRRVSLRYVQIAKVRTAARVGCPF